MRSIPGKRSYVATNPWGIKKKTFQLQARLIQRHRVDRTDAR